MFLDYTFSKNLSFKRPDRNRYTLTIGNSRVNVQANANKLTAYPATDVEAVPLNLGCSDCRSSRKRSHFRAVVQERLYLVEFYANSGIGKILSVPSVTANDMRAV